jgi:hypothetical protein
MLPRHIPPRRPGELWERLQALGIFGVVLVGAVLLLVIQGALAFVIGALGG